MSGPAPGSASAAARATVAAVVLVAVLVAAACGGGQDEPDDERPAGPTAATGRASTPPPDAAGPGGAHGDPVGPGGDPVGPGGDPVGPGGDPARDWTGDRTGDWSRLGARGFVYLLAGTGGRHYEVFRVDPAGGEVDQVTAVPGPFGVSSFSASRAGLVVAEASALVDHVAVLRRDGRLRRLRPSLGSSPDINHRGDVVAHRPTPDGAADRVVLRRRGVDRWERVTEPTSAYTTVRWLDPATLLLVRPGRPTTWTTLRLDGRPERSEQRLAAARLAPEPGAGRYRQPVVLHGWGRTPPALWRPGRRPIALPRGWTNACLSPDGRRVLLLGRDRIGVTGAGGGGEVTLVLDPAPHVLSCAWVDRRFGKR